MKILSITGCLVVVVLLITSCTPMMWTKPGATPDEFRRDKYECERDMRQSGYYGSGIIGAMNMQNFGKQCMRAKGYREMPADSTAVDTSQ